jgi:hypothetical protein
MDHHIIKTICHKANTWYIYHTMYLIFWVDVYVAQYIIYAAENINLNTGNHIYTTSTVNYTKEPFNIYLFKAYQNINYISKKWLTNTSITSDTSHIQNNYKMDHPGSTLLWPKREALFVVSQVVWHNIIIYTVVVLATSVQVKEWVFTTLVV